MRIPFIAAITACAALTAGADAAVPMPAVKASPAGTHGFPFNASALDLARFGFVEEEFLISGTAQAYVNEGELRSDGQWKAKPNPKAKAAYTTRLLVRRPTDPAKFNGVVIVEWLNVSGGYDGAPDWALLSDEILREGYAWVGVSAQFVGAVALQQWENGSANRYAAIVHPGDSFSYDIYSQAAQAIRTPGAVKPLGSLTPNVRELLADGESQSAARMVTYYNAVHPLAKVYSGFLIHSIGFGAPLSQSSGGGMASRMVPPVPAPKGVPVTSDIAPAPNSFIRTDVAEPVMFVNTETDVVVLGAAQSVHQQADSRNFRMWEIAGTAHGDQSLLGNANLDAIKSGKGQKFDCGNPPINNGPDRYAMPAALHALRLWAGVGVAPSTGPRFSVTMATPPAPAVLNRDPATGLVIGGIRLPQIAVPTSTETGTRPMGASTANQFCAVFGASDPWNGDRDPWDNQAGVDPSPTPEPVLSVLYPTHDDYIFKVFAATSDSLMHGYLRPTDAVKIISQAEQAHIPQ